MISRSSVIKMYIARYDFKILRHKNVYCLVWFEDPLSSADLLERRACGTSLSPQSFQEVFYILSPSSPLLPSISHVLQSSWNVSYRGSNPPPKAATGGHRGPQAATGRHRLLNILLPEPLKSIEKQWKSIEIHENLWKSKKIYENLWKSMKIYENLWKSM